MSAQGPHGSSEFAALIGPVARALLGEPNAGLSSKKELRYGARGSLSIDLEKGTWFDHEANEGGGTLDLVERQTGRTERGRLQWLEENGFQLEHDRPNGNGHGAGKQFTIIETYDYVDETGALLSQVCRLDPKDFRQRQPDKSKQSGWNWSTKGVRHVPYRLPELIEAVANESVVFVVEGEKDCNALWRLGVPATTNAGGAGKWHEALNEHFANADVVVIQDNDPQKKHPKTGELLFHDDGRPILPGQDHAAAVCAALTGIAARVRLLDIKKSWPTMPLKGDVSDWLDRGGGNADQLYALVEHLPDWTPADSQAPAQLLVLINIRAWHGVEPPPRRWIVRERIPDINVTLLTGQGGVGKTLLMQQLAVATVLGRDWIGELPEFGPVLFLTAEDDEDELHFRYDKIAQHYDTDFLKLADNGLHLMSLAGQDAAMAVADNRGIVKPTKLFEQLRATAREIRPRWIGLDTAADIFVCNERDRSQVRQCISLLRGICLELKTAVILLAHPSLSGISSGSGLSGSTAWNNSVRSRLYLKNENKKEKSDDEDDDDRDDGIGARTLEFMKSNYSALAAPIKLIWRDGLLVPEATLATLTPAQRAALDQQARDIFMMLLERFNRQDLTVSRKDKANNWAPKVFASEPEAAELHRIPSKRKQLLFDAMKHLIRTERIVLSSGPKAEPPSRRKECLFAGGTLL